MTARTNAAMTKRTAESSSGGAPATPSFPVIHEPLHMAATKNAVSGVTSERDTGGRYGQRATRRGILRPWREYSSPASPDSREAISPSICSSGPTRCTALRTRSRRSRTLRESPTGYRFPAAASRARRVGVREADRRGGGRSRRADRAARAPRRAARFSRRARHGHRVRRRAVAGRKRDVQRRQRSCDRDLRDPRNAALDGTHSHPRRARSLARSWRRGHAARSRLHAFLSTDRLVAPHHARRLAPRYARLLEGGDSEHRWGWGAAPPTFVNIVFGTDGWRARIAEEYTFDAVRVCSQAVAEWVVRNGGADRGVVIGFDRRFVSEHFAPAPAEVVAAHDVNVHLATAAAPTQSVSWATMRRKAKAGIVITASHNPWTDNGFKVKAETGAAAGPDMLKELEAIIHPLEAHPERVRRMKFEDAKAKGRIELFDPAPDYLAHVGELFDLEAFRAAGYTVVCEALYGSAGGYFPKLIGGGKTKIVELHGERNPYFGGVNPEPIPPNIDEFLRRIPAERANVGLAVDGDADRAGLADERGIFVTTLTLYALLMWYLCEVRGLRQPVVKTVNMTSMVDRLGERYGGKVYEVPVGFKYIGPKMQETGAMMGGEESGGFGFGMHLPEPDA